MVDFVRETPSNAANSPSSAGSPDTATGPVISVIIPVRDDAERLGWCLERLSNQTFSKPYEILVIDNGSVDNPETVVERFSLARIITEPRHGSYAARNAGLAQARGEILAFTDSDCLPESNWLEEGVKSLEKAGPESWIGGHIEVFHKNPQRPTPGELWDALHGFPQRSFVEQERFGATANLFVRRSSLESVGPFQQTFISSGDREWGNRASDKGVRGTFGLNVVVNHPSRSSLSALRVKNARMLVGDVQLRQRQGRKLITVPELLVAVCPPIPTLVRDLPKLQPPTMRSRLAYTWAALYITYTTLFDRLNIIREARRNAPN